MLQGLQVIAIFIVMIVIMLVAVVLFFTIAFGLLYLSNMEEFRKDEEERK